MGEGVRVAGREGVGGWAWEGEGREKPDREAGSKWSLELLLAMSSSVDPASFTPMQWDKRPVLQGHVAYVLRR